MSGRRSTPGPDVRNEVSLAGRVSAPAQERVLPSGDSVWTFRVILDRPEGRRARAGVDVIECAVWGGRPRASAPALKAGDVVEVGGALRRRFFRAAGAAASRVEVEVASLRVIRRASSA